MVRIQELINVTREEDKQFVGTIAFQSEDLSLPDGSTVALGIDGERWVLVYQKERGAPFAVYEYNHQTNLLRVDKKNGTAEEYQKMRQLIQYFFSHAHSEYLVTIMPPR